MLYSHLLFLLQWSQMRTSVVQPRSGTGLRPSEHGLQTARPHARQWWRVRLPIARRWFGEAAAVSSSAVPNFCWHTTHLGDSLSGTQYDGLAESFIKSAGIGTLRLASSHKYRTQSIPLGYSTRAATEDNVLRNTSPYFRTVTSGSSVHAPAPSLFLSIYESAELLCLLVWVTTSW